MVEIGQRHKNCRGDQRQRACHIVSDFSRNPVETSWGSWAALLEGTFKEFGAQSSPSKDTVSSLGARLPQEGGASSGLWLLLCRCLSPVTHCMLALLSRWLGRPAPCGVSLERGCPFCCGCFKAPRPVFDLLSSNVASSALSKTQPALNSAGTGSKEERGKDLQ